MDTLKYDINSENLKENYEDSIAWVLDYLGLEAYGKIPPMQIKKQRGFKNYFWKKQYGLFKFIKS